MSRRYEVLKFACLECGHRFRTLKSAERAAFGDEGCPGCGGSDIDMDPGPALKPKTAEDQGFTIGGFYNTGPALKQLPLCPAFDDPPEPCGYELSECQEVHRHTP